MNTRHTRTVANLQVSPGTYAEVNDALKKASYDHAFGKDAAGIEFIDMNGIALVQGPHINPAVQLKDYLVAAGFVLTEEASDNLDAMARYCDELVVG